MLLGGLLVLLVRAALGGYSDESLADDFVAELDGEVCRMFLGCHTLG
jgi:hypothetical protein